jgi:hypothetical protein
MTVVTKWTSGVAFARQSLNDGVLSDLAELEVLGGADFSYQAERATYADIDQNERYVCPWRKRAKTWPEKVHCRLFCGVGEDFEEDDGKSNLDWSRGRLGYPKVSGHVAHESNQTRNNEGRGRSWQSSREMAEIDHTPPQQIQRYYHYYGPLAKTCGMAESFIIIELAFAISLGFREKSARKRTVMRKNSASH